MQLSERLLSGDRLFVLAGLELLAEKLEQEGDGKSSQVRVTLEKIQRGFDLVSVVHTDEVSA